MAEPVKGTVTSLSSIFPAEEAQKASKRVQDAIADQQRELDRLRDFITDNTNLVNLVQRLPNELHHDIMVPFGKAAFFPGRLIHTNEFLVLLGEGYYAERTSKQTIEILKRRGKVLESHVDSLKGIMEDLKAEASFFDTTAAEAAEGLVEIREDFIQENSSDTVSKTGPPEPDSALSVADNTRVGDEDEEFARIMSRLEELEKEELASENVDKHDEDGQISADFAHAMSQHSLNDDLQNSKYESLMAQPVHKDESLHGKSLADNVSQSPSKGKAFRVPEVRENVQVASTSNNEVSVQTSKPRIDSLKAFTGSIVEHSHNLQTNSREQIPASSQSLGSEPSKPVSRFKMQRK